ncbi:MAG: hypothetical protein PHS30_06415 [Bacteroidales bacterium]|nr:hypothetical protein [Bacteroidales bacterium]
MKKIKTMTAAALFAIGTAVMAQAPANRPMRSASERAKMESEMMVKSLGLSTDQTAKVKDINLKYALKDSVSRAERLKNQAQDVDREAMKKAMKAEREAKSNEIKAVLTDAQKMKADALQKEFQNRGPRQGGQGGQGGPGNRPQGGQPQGGQE